MEHQPTGPSFTALSRTITKLSVTFIGMAAALAIPTALLHVNPVVWFRVGGLALAGLLYLFFNAKMAAGRRWAYVRLRITTAAGLIGVVLTASAPGPYPTWMRLALIAPGIVLAALVYALTRPAIRARFRKTTPTALAPEQG